MYAVFFYNNHSFSNHSLRRANCDRDDSPHLGMEVVAEVSFYILCQQDVPLFCKMKQPSRAEKAVSF